MEKSLGKFEKYLWLWVLLCMLIGILLADYFPSLSQEINEWKVGNVSIPIGVCLFFMMYPALMNFQLNESKKLLRAPKPIILTLFSNWVLAPAVTALLAYYFLEGRDQLIVALKNKQFTTAKKWVSSNLDNEPSHIFRTIYDNLYTVFEERTIPQAVLILGNYQYKSAFVADQEINLMSALTEIMMECEFK